MATSKVLQKPQILEIIGSTIRIKHPDISKNIRTQLSTQIAAAGTTMTVLDNFGFEDNDWFIVGEIGDPITEENDVNGAVTRGTSMTVTNALSHSHEYNAPVTKIYERGIKIYGAATDGGSGTLIASIDAKTAATRQLADAQMIQWNRLYTEYTLISTDTTYAYYYVTFTDGTTDSSASDYVASSGLGSSSVLYIIEQALGMTDKEVSDLLPYKDLIRWTNDAQSAISQFMYQDPRSGRLIKMDWPHEITEDITSLSITENENQYALSSLTSAPKDTTGPSSIISVRIGDRKPMEKIFIQDMDEALANKPRTNANGGANIGDTTLTVDSNVEFADSGTLYIGSQQVTYTGKSSTTGFTGIPASGTGSITATINDNDAVWQSIAPAEPAKYTVYNGTLIFNVPPHSDYENYAIKIRYYKALTALTELSDTTSVSFSNAMQHFVASRIYKKCGMAQEAQLEMQEFTRIVTNNAIHSNTPHKDVYTYYKFTDPFNG